MWHKNFLNPCLAKAGQCKREVDVILSRLLPDNILSFSAVIMLDLQLFLFCCCATVYPRLPTPICVFFKYLYKKRFLSFQASIYTHTYKLILIRMSIHALKASYVRSEPAHPCSQSMQPRVGIKPKQKKKKSLHKIDTKPIRPIPITTTCLISIAY